MISNVNVTPEDVEKMKKILEHFNNAAFSIAKKSIEDKNLYEAINTEFKGNSVKIANKYEIKISEVNSLGKNKKVYDIYDIENNEIISKNLYLYEAAYAIVKLLNSGEKLYSDKIRKIIFYEQKYFEERQNYVLFNKILRKCKKEKKNLKEVEIYETKMITAKENALKYKKLILEILESKK